MNDQQFHRATPVTDRPLAIAGLTSYRAKGPFGWIMIGAKDDADALAQARRSSTRVTAEDLQVWDGDKYVSPASKAQRFSEDQGPETPREGTSDPEPVATKITQYIEREDGSEVRIVAEAFFGAGLHRSVGVYVHKRESKDHQWVLCSDQPHPDWRSMSVEEYKKRGRSEMLQTVSIGELLKAMNLVGKPMSQFERPPEADDLATTNEQRPDSEDIPR